MGRLKEINIKIGAVILAFSLILTATFVGMLLWFKTDTSQDSGGGDGLYIVEPVDYKQIVENNGTLQVDAEKFVKEKEYQSKILDGALSSLISISVLFLMVMFFLSLCLWHLLKKLQDKEVVKIADALNFVMTDNVFSSNPTLSLAYEHLKEKFDDSLNDYKRLNSYLSHEQKNSLAILRTNLDLSQSTEYLKNLDYISDSIDDVLTLSENSEMSPLVSVDVSLVCAEVCDNYLKIFDKITFQFDEDEDTEILARRRWVYRAVANLLDNAIKYGENQPILVSVKAKKGSVIISVSDNGIGIGKEKQEKIFGNRFRVNELNKDGYGIGLSLVSHVCDLCGGFVMLDSDVGKGSTFYLSFPQNLF